MAGRHVRALMLALGAWLLAAGYSLSAQAPASRCHAYSTDAVTLDQASSLDWVCDDTGWLDGQQVAWLRFTGWDSEEPPLQLASRITGFRTITVAAVGRDGGLQSRTYGMEDGRPVVAGGVFTLPLPEAGADTTAYLVRIEHPHSVTVTSEARLIREVGDPTTAVILLALVAGMLITPLLFDINFYLVLRERFVLLHAGMVLAMIGYTLFSGGLITAFVTLPLGVMATLGPLCFPIGGGVGAFFIRDFLERDALPRWLDRALVIGGWWLILVPGFCALKFDFSQPFDNQLYFAAFTPVIPLFIIAIVVGLVRGSRSARFLAAAWLPIIATGMERFLRGIGLYAAETSVDHWLILAMGVEVNIIALGVAYRFLALRRERDLARSEAQALEELAERDPLTGLMNRRAIEPRFRHLRSRGFTAFALIDLDHFKQVNDCYGHAIGDDVLRSVARALDPDDDTLVVRQGGEEFMLLLRGPEARERAEQRRRAISLHVAREVTGLDRIVTASMGIVEASPEVMRDASFDELFEKVDELLYQAKREGRNRTCHTRMAAPKPSPTPSGTNGVSAAA